MMNNPNDDTTTSRRSDYLVLAGLLTVIGLFVGAIVFMGLRAGYAGMEDQAERDRINARSHGEWETLSSTRLAAMANASETSGTSLIFAVRVEEQNVIRYTEILDDGGFQLKEIDADGVTIYELDPESDDPHVSTGEPRLERQACRVVAPTDDEQQWLAEHDAEACGTRVVIYVPKGSVSTDFSVDPSN